MVFGVAVGLVFLILVIQFQAWVPAIVILVAAPLSLGGALLLLWLTGTDLNISSAMGLILLVGLVARTASCCSTSPKRSMPRASPSTPPSRMLAASACGRS